MHCEYALYVPSSEPNKMLSGFLLSTQTNLSLVEYLGYLQMFAFFLHTGNVVLVLLVLVCTHCVCTV